MEIKKLKEAVRVFKKCETDKHLRILLDTCQEILTGEYVEKEELQALQKLINERDNEVDSLKQMINCCAKAAGVNEADGWDVSMLLEEINNLQDYKKLIDDSGEELPEKQDCDENGNYAFRDEEFNQAMDQCILVVAKLKQENKELKQAVMVGVVMLYEQYPEETKKRFSLEELLSICRRTNKLKPKQVGDIFYEVLFGEK